MTMTLQTRILTCPVEISGRTATGRRKLPLPVAELIRLEIPLKGRILNFGCGRDSITSRTLSQFPGVESVSNYDPNFAALDLSSKKYDVILCVYVINTLPILDRMEALARLTALAEPDGAVYVAVRDDFDSSRMRPFLDGYFTSIGTFQKKYTAAEFSSEVGRLFPYVELLPARGCLLAEGRLRPKGEA